MPPSQLKRLKASLREQGITGPQKSKKEKKRAGKDVAKRAQRNQALESIRDSFNPFEIKAKTRPEKFQSTTLHKKNAKEGMVSVARPGVTKSLGEETVGTTLGISGLDVSLTDDYNRGGRCCFPNCRSEIRLVESSTGVLAKTIRL